MQYWSDFDLSFLFFFLGVVASWLKSDLEIPESISKFLSLVLLLSLGLKGGREVAIAPDLSGFYVVAFAGFASCFVIPYYLFPLLKRRLGADNAAAMAACYGSVSAITFVAGQEFLAARGVEFGGYMVALMALMEVPAIVVAVFFYKRSVGVRDMGTSTNSLFSAKSAVLLLGGFVIGILMNDVTWKGLSPLVKDNFKGILSFFLLDLGISAQRQLRLAWSFKFTALLTACVLPLLNGTVMLVFAKLLGIPRGDEVLLAVLAGSASYIAAPAAVRASMPGANPSLYAALPLALTFPMNIVIGIPYYYWISSFF